MKFFTIALFATAVLASPAPLQKRQSANDFVSGGCKSVIMAYARGSTELGNVGTLGPGLESGLSRAFSNDFAMQGVEYPADLASNFLPDGSNAEAIATMANLLKSMASKCPNARLVAGGYSQGSAVASNAIEGLPSDVRDRIDAVVVFGYTKNLQNAGKIPNYPSDKLKVFCALGDMVCSGTLIITASHLTYAANIGQAVNFIESKVQV